MTGARAHAPQRADTGTGTPAPGAGPDAVEAGQRRLTMAALMIVLLLAALDQTVVSTAMPRIIAELSGLHLYAWVTTLYLLTSTATVPVWGKLGDLKGRRFVLIWGVVIFVAGSWLCGLSGEFGRLPVLGGGMTQLILFRGVQGIGGGALMTSAFAAVGDLYPPRQRGKISGLFGAMFALAGVLGPILGGFFTEHGTVTLYDHRIEGWRWVFYVNLPVALVALGMILKGAPALRRGRGGRIDLPGAALVMSAFAPLLLALSLGGRQLAWTSAPLLGLVALSALSFWGFVVAERRAAEPIVPLDLFANRTFSAANAAAFVMNAAFMGALTFLPLQLQLAMGMSATESGMAMLPLMFSVVLGAALSGLMVTRTGRYKPFMLGGAAVTVVGLLILTTLSPASTMIDVLWRLALVGLGLGPAQSLYSLATQNAVGRDQMGVATSASQFLRQLGGMTGAAAFGAVMTHALALGLAAHGVAAGAGVSIDALQSEALATGLTHGQGAAMGVRLAFQSAMDVLYFAAAGVGLIGLGLVVLIPELPLSGRSSETRTEPGRAAAGGG